MGWHFTWKCHYTTIVVCKFFRKKDLKIAVLQVTYIWNIWDKKSFILMWAFQKKNHHHDTLSDYFVCQFDFFFFFFARKVRLVNKRIMLKYKWNRIKMCRQRVNLILWIERLEWNPPKSNEHININRFTFNYMQM